MFGDWILNLKFAPCIEILSLALKKVFAKWKKYHLSSSLNDYKVSIDEA